MNRGKLIVIEGSDGTGKETQAKLLAERINEKVHLQTFPQYESPWGGIIREYLEGNFGGLDEVNPYLASLLYTGDRSVVAQRMNNILISGDWIVCDRYLQSNFAHQGVKISDTEERNKFVNWLEDKEYEQFGLPRPDKVIILDLSSAIKQKHITERRILEDRRQKQDKRLFSDRRHRDIHEDNLDYLSRVSLEYNRLAELKNWEIINCSPNGVQLSEEEVANEIFEIIFKV